MKLREIVSRVVIEPRKLTECALNLDNPKGADKAVMFQCHLGFTKDNYEPLLEQISAQALEAESILQRTDERGNAIRWIWKLGSGSRAQEVVRTGWIVEPDSDAARLVTLYVRKRQ
jgi:filamentous hemagglutinin